MRGMALSIWELVPLPAWIAYEINAFGEAALTWELVVTVRGEMLAALASVHPAWELVLTARGEVLAAQASVCSAWGEISLRGIA